MPRHILGYNFGGNNWWKILHEDLGLNKFSARWIPKLLNSEQKLCWQHICEENLEALCLKEFFSKIVTGDKTWMYFWDTPTKHEFMQWVHKGSPPPKSKNAEFMRKSNGDGVLGYGRNLID
ncbi:unnamed protein product [Tenebrio molitor]|jgi:hypothetical protein|nr:unnamed protein product [Tenebrio molitor]